MAPTFQPVGRWRSASTGEERGLVDDQDDQPPPVRGAPGACRWSGDVTGEAAGAACHVNVADMDASAIDTPTMIPASAAPVPTSTACLRAADRSRA